MIPESSECQLSSFAENKLIWKYKLPRATTATVTLGRIDSCMFVRGMTD